MRLAAATPEPSITGPTPFSVTFLPLMLAPERTPQPCIAAAPAQSASTNIPRRQLAFIVASCLTYDDR